MPVLDLSDASVFYIQRGEGPDIVSIPGGDSLATDWNDQISVFEQNYRNTAFDPGAQDRLSAAASPHGRLPITRPIVRA